MSVFGLILLASVGVVLVGTGLPAAFVLMAGAVLGGLVAAIASPGEAAVLAAASSRIVNLFESDLLQALPLYVLMGCLLQRLPLVESMFGAATALGRGSPAYGLAAGLGLGALLAPMNGSVAASVVALSRAIGPRLSEEGVPKAVRVAVIAVAGTFGVVVPPSLVLILLSDAMMTAHTIALNAAGRMDRVINTQDLFRGAMAPAGLFIALAIVVAWWTGRALGDQQPGARKPVRLGDIITSLVTLTLVGGLLAGVAAGRLYAVEAAAVGAVGLFGALIASGRLGGTRGLALLLNRAMEGTGALFALLVAATTLTLTLRILGTDKLVAGAVAAIPGGGAATMAVVLMGIGLAGLVLDAFEIIFVIVPIVAPPVLERAPDAVWVAVLVLLMLQFSYLLPPFGYAVLLARGSAKPAPRNAAVWRALLPFLAAQACVMAAVFAYPPLVHGLGGPAAEPGPAALSTDEVSRRFQSLIAPQDDDPPPLTIK